MPHSKAQGKFFSQTAARKMAAAPAYLLASDSGFVNSPIEGLTTN
jgi:hypothetical protein